MNDNPHSSSNPQSQPLHRDELTGLPNRTIFLTEVATALDALQRQDTTQFAVLLLACDNLETINSSLGHPAGDQVLIGMAERLRAGLAEQDSIAHISDDKFAILLRNVPEMTTALATAERILYDLSPAFPIAENNIFVSVSIGIVISVPPSSSAIDLLRDADTALQHARALGRGRYSVFDAHMHDQVVRRLKMETELRQALDQDELRVVYQPIVSLTTGLITGFEALVRWQHPNRQLLAPADFLPMAEELGLSVLIDRWVLQTACQQMYTWLQRFPAAAHLTISVNMSGQQIRQPDLVPFVQSVLQETGLPPQNLILEMTEETVLSHRDTTIHTLERLQTMGVLVSLDDFGTGYSSLSYLHYLPIATLKVDRSFISGMDVSPQAAIVVNTIITLAHALGLDVVAEGIETLQHLNTLRTSHCERAQGFFFSRPVDVASASALLAHTHQYLVLEGSSVQIPDADALPAPVLPPAPHDTSGEAPAPTTAASPLPSVPLQDTSLQTDPLTGVFTRALLPSHLREAAAQSLRTGEPYTLAVVDIDHFKSVNDAFGHARGDAVLVEFAQRIQMAIRTQDSMFRYGGDEFVLLLPNMAGEQAATFAERILEVVRDTPFQDDPPLSLTVSIGLAVFPNDSQNSDQLFTIADARNYQAKRAGRGQAMLHDRPTLAPLLLDGPMRLIERDQPIQTLQTFLNALTQQTRGVFQITGVEGSGITRFLTEASNMARLQGYGVLELRGIPAQQDRVYGALSELGEEWQTLPLPAQGTAAFAHALRNTMARKNYLGLVITLDELPYIDQPTIEFLQTLFTLPDVPHLALIYATSGAEPPLRLPQDTRLAVQTVLEPLSLMGLRTWMRHSLNWEPPDELLLWFYDQTGGQPANIARGLHHVLTHELLYPTASGWGYRPSLLNNQITAQLAKEAALPRHNLPPRLTDFVGRETELAQVKKLVQQQRAVAIIGLGGLGKSRLALQAAAEALNVFANGVCYVQLAHLSSVDFLIYTIADALGVTLVGAQSPREQILFHLSTRNMLLLLDNFEHLREDTFLLEEIVARAPGVHLLITSRDRVMFTGAVSFELRGLAYPHTEREEDIAHYSAVQLFVRRAQQAYGEFELTPENAPSVGRICRLVEGLPLGLELAAAWMRTFSCEAIADKIELNLSFLEHNDSAIVERHRSLMAIIDSFWFLLSEHERSLLRQMSVFRGGFDGNAARAVIEASPFFLEGLVAKGYIRWTKHKRYEIHELLRQYAAEKLQALPDEEQQAAAQHSSYYLALVQRRDLEQFGSRHMLEEISVNLENIRTAWYWAVQTNQQAELAQSLDGLENFYEFKGRFHEAETLFRAAAEQLAAASTDPATAALVGRLRAGQARFFIRCSRYTEAIETAQAVREQAQHLGDEALEGLAAYHWGTALWHQGGYTAAQQHLLYTANVAQRLQLAQLHADSLRRLSRVTCEMGNYAESRVYGERSLAICRRLGERQREARMLNDLGIVADAQGDFIASKAYYERCLQVYREIGDQPGEANALMNLGAVDADQGNYASAERGLEHALRLFQESGNLRDEAIVLENLGDTARRQNELERATAYYEQALRICQQISDQQGQSYLLGNLGLVAHLQGEHQVAQNVSQQALDLALAIGDSRARGNALTYLGHALSALELLDAAASHYQQAIDLYRELGQLHLCADALAGLARLALQRTAPDEALQHIETILAYLAYGTLDGTAEPFRIYLTCYQVLAAHDDLRARTILTTAFTLLQQQAARITVAARRMTFLEQSPVHQAILHLAQEQSLTTHSTGSLQPKNFDIFRQTA